MSYDDDEESVSNSAPVELYDFLIGLTHYRLTTWQSDYVFGGNTFTATPGMRGVIKASASADPPDLEVTIRAATTLGQALLRPTPQTMVANVYRVQQVSGEYRTPWAGRVTLVALQGRWVKITIPSLLSKLLDDEFPPRAHQHQCGHVLYDEHCLVDPADSSPTGIPYKRTTTITDITGNVVTVASVGTWPDGWGNAGKVEHPVTGEKRRIASQVGTAIKIGFPVDGMQVGDTVDLFAGCNHLVKTGCRDKFDNVLRFGGMPWIPRTNPFLFGLRGLFQH